MDERVRRKSSYSDKTDCVQVGFPTESDATFEIDDTKDPGPALVLAPGAFFAFLDSVRTRK